MFDSGKMFPFGNIELDLLCEVNLKTQTATLTAYNAVNSLTVDATTIVTDFESAVAYGGYVLKEQCPVASTLPPRHCHDSSANEGLLIPVCLLGGIAIGFVVTISLRAWCS